MTRKNLMFIDSDGYASLVTVSDDGYANPEITTTCLGSGRYVKIDDGRNYPQLCRHGARLGNTLIYTSNEQLARDCDARLYKTRAGYEKAKAKLEFFPVY